MMPKLPSGFFLTLGLLLARRSEAGAAITDIAFFESTLSCVSACCQDNTWDIALADHPLHPEPGKPAFVEAANENPDGEIETFCTPSWGKLEQTLVRLRRRSPIQFSQAAFSRSLFHPPTAIA